MGTAADPFKEPLTTIWGRKVYPLLPWKWLTFLLAVVVAATVYADDLGRWVGVNVPDTMLVRLLPMILLTLFSGFFAPRTYWAPWRIAWRCIPGLSSNFPDLNGLWVGSTSSNWPTITKLVETAQSDDKVTEQKLYDIPEQRDAIAVRIQNSLFALRVSAGLSSTEGESYSITAKPWRDQHTGLIHISYVYQQQTPSPAATDEETHLGAADLTITAEHPSRAEGTYWTRRSWKTGRNTAGKLELVHVSQRVDRQRTLRQHAAEHKAKLAGG
jgi:SMODS-associating 2TM, beta-strand rich effector domain